MRVIMTGSVTLVSHLAQRLLDGGHEVTVIHRDPAECRALARAVAARVVCGDPAEPRVLEECGAGAADAVMALTDEDERNLAICQLARLRFGVARPMAFVNDPDNEEVFRGLGVEAAFTPVRILVSLVDQRARLGEVTGVVPVAGGMLFLSEVDLGPTSPACGLSLRDLALPKGALVAYVLRGGALVVPGGDTVLAADDRLLLMATPETTTAALARLADEGGEAPHG